MAQPQPSGAFEWTQAPWGSVLACRPARSPSPITSSPRRPEAARRRARVGAVVADGIGRRSPERSAARAPGPRRDGRRRAARPAATVDAARSRRDRQRRPDAARSRCAWPIARRCCSPTAGRPCRRPRSRRLAGHGSRRAASAGVRALQASFGSEPARSRRGDRPVPRAVLWRGRRRSWRRSATPGTQRRFRPLVRTAGAGTVRISICGAPTAISSKPRACLPDKSTSPGCARKRMRMSSTRIGRGGTERGTDGGNHRARGECEVKQDCASVKLRIQHSARSRIQPFSRFRLVHPEVRQPVRFLVELPPDVLEPARRPSCADEQPRPHVERLQARDS